METSSERAHADDYRTRRAFPETHWLSWCDECEVYQSSTRDITINGFTKSLCRDCRPFDHPCEACGLAERHPGCDSCLACEIIGDLHSVRAEIAGAM